jgi:23S rRNA pseudouridine1911/1915/1917 synthase
MELRVAQGGPRVDKYIAQEAPDLSRSFVKKLLHEGRVTVDGNVPKASYRVQAGDVIVVRVPPPEPAEVRAEEIPLRILYEDADIVVVDKPAGMVVHPAHGHRSGTLVNALLAHCTDLSGIGGELRPGIVHRLDKDTSGLLLVAKNDVAHRHLQRQFKERLVHKTYLALTEGLLPTPRGVIDAPIGRHPQQRKRMAVVPRGGREARTEYRVLERFAEHTLVEAEPVTGRTHQITSHPSAIPLLATVSTASASSDCRCAASSCTRHASPSPCPALESPWSSHLSCRTTWQQCSTTCVGNDQTLNRMTSSETTLSHICGLVIRIRHSLSLLCARVRGTIYPEGVTTPLGHAAN